MLRNNDRRGFTIMEVIVVIAVMVLLSSVVFTALQSARIKARDAQRIANARQIGVALEQYETTTGSYRVSGAGFQNTGTGYATKMGTADYSTSIVSKLKSLQNYTSEGLRDPVYGDSNYYVGVCDDGRYNIYLKTEQDVLHDASSTIQESCDGVKAESLGFNHVLGGAFPTGGGSATTDGVSGAATWTSAAGIGGGGDPGVWSSIAYGGGVYVAVSANDSGVSNKIMTSVDGMTWVSRTAPSANAWRSVTYGNGIFVAVASYGVGAPVITSADGITWVERKVPVCHTWRSVIFANNRFVAVGYDGAMSSPDGITWTPHIVPTADTWASLTYGNGLFVAVADGGLGGRVMVSPDGATWTAYTAAASSEWISVAYGNNTFVAVAYSGSGGRVMVSIDGMHWTQRNSTNDENRWSSVAFGDGLFVAVAKTGSGELIMASPDGITWTARKNPPTTDMWRAVTYGDGKYVAVGDAVMVCPQ